MDNPREQARRIQGELQNSTGYEIDQVRKLLVAKYEDAKIRLVEAVGEDIPRVQGEARTYKKLLDDLTWKPQKKSTEGAPS